MHEKKYEKSYDKFPGTDGLCNRNSHLIHLVSACLVISISRDVVVGVSFISRFRLRPLMGTRQERPGMYFLRTRDRVSEELVFEDLCVKPATRLFRLTNQSIHKSSPWVGEVRVGRPSHGTLLIVSFVFGAFTGKQFMPEIVINSTENT